MTDNTSPQKDFFGPPKLAERILSLLLAPEDAETVLGDFAEICSQQNSQRRAHTWYWSETLRSASALLRLKLSRQFERSFTVMKENMELHNKNFLWISLIALIPALMLIIPGLSQSLFGYFGPSNAMDNLYANAPYLEILRSPVLLLGGLLLAFLLNLLPAMKLCFKRGTEGLTSVITFKPVLVHWAIIGMSLLMVGIITIYVFLENFGPF
jgi:amino acid transporter